MGGPCSEKDDWIWKCMNLKLELENPERSSEKTWKNRINLGTKVKRRMAKMPITKGGELLNVLLVANGLSLLRQGMQPQNSALCEIVCSSVSALNKKSSANT